MPFTKAVCWLSEGLMRRNWFTALLLLGACAGTESPISNQETKIGLHKVYLVRHAEKQAGEDPSLTAAGEARAAELADLLVDQGLAQIHSTNYKRTLETAAPLAARTGLEVVLYDPRDLDRFAGELRASVGVHLVVGHSNTTPQLATALGGDPGGEIDETAEYDRLYVIDLSSGAVVSSIERYGVRFQSSKD